MTETRRDRDETIQSVEMALSVLETLANAKSDMGVTSVAAELATTKSRIHRHLRTLVSLGYISQSEQTDQYRIGPRLITLGRAAAGSINIGGIAQPHMRTLRDKTSHAVSLGQVEANGIRILDTLPGMMQIDVGVRPGSLLGFTNSAQGKAAISAMSVAKRRNIMALPPVSTTRFTITDTEVLETHIDEVKSRGWATAPNESMVGLNALACPILDADGEPVATIALVSLTQFIETVPSTDLIDAVREAASKISGELGYHS